MKLVIEVNVIDIDPETTHPHAVAETLLLHPDPYEVLPYVRIPEHGEHAIQFVSAEWVEDG